MANTAASFEPYPRLRWQAGLGVVVLLPALVMVNILIYHARIQFSAWHPEKVAWRPPTISGAIADPRIGEPFGTWNTFLAVMLATGVAIIIRFGIRDWQNTPTPARSGIGRGWAVNGGALIPAFQVVACVGMVMLSRYRFPDGHDIHMLGSYIFFTGQAVTILWAGFWCRQMAQMEDLDHHVFKSKFLRSLTVLAWVPVGLSLFYLVLFIGKDMVPETISPVVYQTYVWTELATISSSTLYFGLFLMPLASLMLGRRPTI